MRGELKIPYCPFCDRWFKSLTALYMHFRAHYDGLDYHCEFCGETFRMAYFLRLHIEERHRGSLPKRQPPDGQVRLPLVFA